MGKNTGKNISKNLSGKCSQKFLDMLSNLQQMHIKLLQKEQYLKQKKQLAVKLLIELQKSQKHHNGLIQKQLQMSMIKKYLKKDVSLQKKDGKLLMV